jgi:prepilin-type N-terminal cleavage/methylation domain-containing protein
MARLRPRRDETGFTLVELLVVIVIMSVVASAITSVVISTFRIEQRQATLQDVVDDGRISLQRIKRELRAARRVHEDSGPRNLRFWVDQDQDQVVSPEEQICYLVELLPGATAQWQISRWTHAVDEDDCVEGAEVPTDATRTIVARTLVEPDAFVAYDPVPGGPTDPATREVTIRLVLEVVGARNFGQTTVEGAVRLRNVP